MWEGERTGNGIKRSNGKVFGLQGKRESDGVKFSFSLFTSKIFKRGKF